MQGRRVYQITAFSMDCRAAAEDLSTIDADAVYTIEKHDKRDATHVLRVTPHDDVRC